MKKTQKPQIDLIEIDRLLDQIEIPSSKLTIYCHNGIYPGTEFKTPPFEFPRAFILPCTFYKLDAKVDPKEETITLIIDSSYPSKFYDTDRIPFTTYTVTGIYSKTLTQLELEQLEIKQLDWFLHICDLQNSYQWKIPIDITWKNRLFKIKDEFFPFI
ncbi:hypothetical protein [Chroococcus sp. FPU101]|uniref:hypothetical protein n=1 Tax=Chroococcus sp. FPU101 TaxID=1974212 RepID=UPI001A8CC63E|nr:hypothetical protein [Chroococcus sp. FPU101]GFE69080.1 hypothetical protein CFPU101_16900 [Chroococcus sp. FPU101]